MARRGHSASQCPARNCHTRTCGRGTHSCRLHALPPLLGSGHCIGCSLHPLYRLSHHFVQLLRRVAVQQDQAVPRAAVPSHQDLRDGRCAVGLQAGGQVWMAGKTQQVSN